MQEDIVLAKNKNMVSRLIGWERILLPNYKTSNEINCIYTLNKAAAWVWEKIDGKRSLGDITKEALLEFECAEKGAQEKLKALIKDLKSINAVV